MAFKINPPYHIDNTPIYKVDFKDGGFNYYHEDHDVLNKNLECYFDEILIVSDDKFEDGNEGNKARQEKGILLRMHKIES